jgi:signal transduction histidine kinase
LSAIAIRGTLSGSGPFAIGNDNESLLLLQSFMGINTLMALILAAVVSERARAHEERRHLLQREENARAEAERANRAKDQFLAVLSHELRTPLTPVLLSAAALEHDADLPPHLADYVQIIRRNVELEARLIDDLLDLTRIARGKVKLELAIIDIHDVLRHSVEICFAKGDRQPSIELAAHRHHVRGDPARLRQVFWNLANNAVKFTPAGQPIAIRSRNSENSVEIDIADSGVGIEPEFMPRLFNAFEQGDPNQARTFGGLGLGLAITKTLVESHGGIVTAHSAGRNTGATFTVRLPIADDVSKTERTAISPPDRFQSLPARVLLVEDHEETLKILAKLLVGLGHQVTTASTIKSALEAAACNNFDLIISDLGLPDGLGYELMRSLRARRNLPGIALSGYGMSDDIQRSEEAGFAEHLVKPVDLNKLREAIGRVLSEKK